MASTTTTSATSPTTTTLSPGSTTSTVPASSNAGGPKGCTAASLKVARGGSQGAAGTIYTGFTISDKTSVPCTLDGYPAVSLVPHSGTLHPTFSHSGFKPPSSIVVGPGGAGAAFVLRYSDVQENGQTSCPQIDAIKARMPGTAPAQLVPFRIYPCGAPSIGISAVVSAASYRAEFS
ncbi:MAG: DUF4232 domain-containing protein [Acidimicrobiales bacterium]